MVAGRPAVIARRASVEERRGPPTLTTSVHGGRTAKVGIQRVDAHGFDGFAVGLDVANQAPVGAQQIDLSVHGGGWTGDARSDHHDLGRIGRQVGVRSVTESAVVITTSVDGDTRPHAGHRATGSHRVDKGHATAFGPRDELSGVRIDGRDDQIGVGPVDGRQSVFDDPSPRGFVDRGCAESEFADASTLFIRGGAPIDRQTEHSHEQVEIEIGRDLVVFVGDLGGEKILEVRTTEKLGAHHRSRRGPDDAVDAGGQVDPLVTETDQDSGLPGDSGHPTTGQNERERHGICLAAGIAAGKQGGCGAARAGVWSTSWRIGTSSENADDETASPVFDHRIVVGLAVIGEDGRVDAYSARLLESVTAVVVPWARRLVDERLVSDGLMESVSQEARRSAVAETERLAVDGLSELLKLDAEQQRTNPLTVLRSATIPLGRFLSSVGATPVARDEFDRRSLPDDVFGLAPATWADIDPSLVEPGLEWGAWKAATIISRRRNESS